MDDRQFFVNNEWLNYTEAHSLGYTLEKPDIIELYNETCDKINIIRDISDSTYYDKDKLVWYSDIIDLNLYLKFSTVRLFKIDEFYDLQSYSNSILFQSSSHVCINGKITSIVDLYNNYGITKNECSIYIVKDGVCTVWYDPATNLYWDDKEKCWLIEPPSSKGGVQFSDVIAHHKIIEDQLTEMSTYYNSSSSVYMDDENINIVVSTTGEMSVYTPPPELLYGFMGEEAITSLDYDFTNKDTPICQDQLYEYKNIILYDFTNKDTPVYQNNLLEYPNVQYIIIVEEKNEI